MAGYFDNSGEMGLSETSNNVASDFDRLSATGTDFRKPSLFDRLFGRKTAGGTTSEALPSPTAMKLPDVPSPQGTPSPNIASTGKPAISSGDGLLARILHTMDPNVQKYNADGQVLVPGTPFTPEQFIAAMQRAVQQNATAAPYQIPGMPQDQQPGMGPPSTPAMSAPRSPTPVTYGGNTFGGHTFGGNTYGGHTFGASAAAPNMVSPMAVGALSNLPHIPQPRTILPPYEIPGLPPQVGYFSGGDVHMAHGGYPEHLMFGMPTRFEHGDYVSSDGQGDGRSDHVDAKLSPGEFVMDAETVALLGNGDNEAGARKLDELRHNLRKQKGEALANGRFSPDAKNPAAYMKKRSG